MASRGLALAQVLALALLPQVLPADVLTFAIWPDANPAHSIACRVELFHGQIIAVEVRGTGMPARRALRWPAGLAERAALRQALGAFLTGDLPSVEPYGSRVPPAPYVTVTWSTLLNDAPVSGLYLQHDLTLPGPLAGVLRAVIPGSGCDLAVQ